MNQYVKFTSIFFALTDLSANHGGFDNMNIFLAYYLYIVISLKEEVLESESDIASNTSESANDESSDNEVYRQWLIVIIGKI